MLWVQLENGAPAETLAMTDILHRYPDISFSEGHLTAQPVEPYLSGLIDLLAEFDVYPLTLTEPPEASPFARVVPADPIEVEGVWTQQWAVEPLPLEEAQAMLRARIDARRDQCFADGFTPSSGPLAGKTLQTRGVEDRTNWLTSQAAYSAAVVSGDGAVENAAFRTADNETIVLSYADGLGVLLAMAGWGKAIMGNSWMLKDAVDAAEDVATLEAIDTEAGWP